MGILIGSPFSIKIFPVLFFCFIPMSRSLSMLNIWTEEMIANPHSCHEIPLLLGSQYTDRQTTEHSLPPQCAEPIGLFVPAIAWDASVRHEGLWARHPCLTVFAPTHYSLNSGREGPLCLLVSSGQKQTWETERRTLFSPFSLLAQVCRVGYDWCPRRNRFRRNASALL